MFSRNRSITYAHAIDFTFDLDEDEDEDEERKTFDEMSGVGIFVIVV